MFRLCLALGCPHPDLLLASLTARQVQEWIEFYRLEPWGDERADWRIAQLCALTFNAHRDPRKARAAKVADFMWDQNRAQTPEEMMRIFDRLARRGERQTWPRRSARSRSCSGPTAPHSPPA